MQDLNDDMVQVQVRRDGSVLWVNGSEGECILRISGIKKLYLDIPLAIYNHEPPFESQKPLQ